jgi:hypothetical protein
MIRTRADNYTNQTSIRIDESTTGTTYVGKAPLASSEATAIWQIMKIVESSGITTITWADGDSSFNNIWSNRASLTYS